MAAVCLAAATAVVGLSAGTRLPDAASRRSHRPAVALRLPLVAALGAGLVSAATWTYGPTTVVARGALDRDQVGLLWAALGLGGLVGAFVDRAVSRWGPATTFLLSTAALVVGSV